MKFDGFHNQSPPLTMLETRHAMKMVAQDVSGKGAIENENHCTHGLISIFFLNERAIKLISFHLDKHQEQVNFFG